MTATYTSNLPRGFSEEYNRLVYRCPEKQCYYSRQVTERVIPTHKCPQINGQTKVAWSVYGPSLLQQTWAELDRVTAEIIDLGKNPVDTPTRQIGYAQGLAWTLSLFMMPHFATPQDIAREAKKRYEMKKAGEEYETPGLGSRKYEAPPDNYKTDRQSPRPTAAKSKREPKLAQAEIDSIKNAIGMFSAEELAKIYKVSVDTVKQIVAEA